MGMEKNSNTSNQIESSILESMLAIIFATILPSERHKQNKNPWSQVKIDSYTNNTKLPRRGEPRIPKMKNRKHGITLNNNMLPLMNMSLLNR